MAVTVCAPFVEAGAAIVALNDPVVDEATVVGEVDCMAPSYLIVMVEDGANPVPATVIVVPVGPAVGVRVMEAVTENVTDAV